MNKYFGESARYLIGNDDEEFEAKDYLEKWKKFLLRRLIGEGFKPKLIDEQWLHKDANYSGCLSQYQTIALKICIDIEFDYELRH